MDERVRRTVETYEENADAYAEIHGDRSVIADLVGDFVAAVEDGRDLAAERTTARDGGSSGRPRVLDVGPGPGWESATFDDHGFDVAAVDVTRSFLEQTRERAPGAGVVNGDMRSLPFADDSFDGVWVCASLLHVPREDVPPTLAEFERVLAPDGATVVSLQRRRAGPGGGESDVGDGGGSDVDDGGGSDVDDGDGSERGNGDGSEEADSDDGERDDTDGSAVESVVRSPYDDDRRHFERYAPDEIREAFEAAGFAVESVETDGDWVAITARAE